MAEVIDVATLIPNTWEGKRKHRWLFNIEGIDAYLIKTAARPQMALGEVAIDWLNAKRYLSGKAEWQALNVVLYDAIAPSGAQQVMEWIRVHYESVSGRAGYADFYKRDIQLKMLDGPGTVVELWDIKGAMITDANFNEIDYSQPEVTEIALTIRFDNAVLQY